MKWLHGENGTYLYTLWVHIKQRCFKKDDVDYKYYGGRGIKMYKPWIDDYLSFRNYIVSTIGYRPSKKHSLDRINNDGNYEPNNIRWATVQQQRINRRVFKNNKSGYVGVYFSKFHNKWVSSIRHNKKGIHVGYFNSKHDAVNARNKYIKENNLPHKTQEVNG